jgi:hypothetical protein
MDKKYQWLVVLGAATLFYLLGPLFAAPRALYSGMTLGLTGISMSLYLTSQE